MEAYQEAAAQMFRSFAAFSEVLTLVREQGREIAAMRADLSKRLAPSVDDDGWLDAKGAAKYLSMSSGSFDKYRYKTSPRIPGYQLDGKTLYKREDLDNFVRLYELKSAGLA